MAFEEDFGIDPSQPQPKEYTLSATGVVSRTLSLWTGKLLQYIMIVGIISAVCAAISFVLLYTIFGTIGVIVADPISYIFNIFAYTTFPEVTIIAVSIGFGIVAYVLTAIVAGAAIKFALDDYTGQKGDVGVSFSHSFGKVSNIIIVQIVISFLSAALLIPGMILLFRSMVGVDISDPFDPYFPPGSLELMAQAMGFLLVGLIVLLYLQSRFAPTLAIVVDTDLSAIDSLKKSWELTSGNVLHVLASQILIALVVGVATMIISFGASYTPFYVVVEAILIGLLLSSINYVFASVLYKDLASRTETYDLPEYVL